MRKILLIHVVLGVGLGLGGALLYTEQHGLSVLLGNLFGAGVTALFALAWYFGVRKKLFALALGVIVIKYAILGVGLYVVLRVWKVDPLAFSLGISTLAITAVVSTRVKNVI